jgi:hypothetical protein
MCSLFVFEGFSVVTGLRRDSGAAVRTKGRIVKEGEKCFVGLTFGRKRVGIGVITSIERQKNRWLIQCPASVGGAQHATSPPCAATIRDRFHGSVKRFAVF